MTASRSRRRFLAQAGLTLGAFGAPVLPRIARARASVRLVLLGTKGGPRPAKRRHGPSQALVVGDDVFVIDCGDGVATQLVRAGLPLRNVRHVFLTHLHSDHTADYGNLLYFAWYSGLKRPIHTWGPPPIEALTEAALAYHAFDVKTRMEDEGRKAMAPLVEVHALVGPGPVLDTPRVRVAAGAVEHPPLVPSFAYRFDTYAGSVVVSGDTAPCEGLVDLAKDADVLVHEVVHKQRLEAFLDGLPSKNARFKRHLVQSHSTTEQVGRTAARAGVKKLVLSHFVPGGDDGIPDEVWRRAVARHYGGPIVVGRDLMEIPIG